MTASSNNFVIIGAVCVCVLLLGIAVFMLTSKSQSTVVTSSSGYPKAHAFLQKHASEVKDGATGVENLDVLDNLDAIRTIFADAVQALPERIRQRIKCEDLNRETLMYVVRCVLDQVDYSTVDDDSAIIIIVARMVLYPMLSNPEYTARDVLEYDRESKIIKMKDKDAISAVQHLNSLQVLFITVDGKRTAFRTKDGKITTMVHDDEVPEDVIEKYQLRTQQFSSLNIDPNNMSLPDFITVLRVLPPKDPFPRDCMCTPN